MKLRVVAISWIYEEKGCFFELVRREVIRWLVVVLLLGPMNLWADAEVANILRNIEVTPSPTATPQAPRNIVRTPSPTAPPQPRPAATPVKKKVHPAKMPSHRLEIGDLVRGPFYVIGNTQLSNGRYHIMLSTKHSTKGRIFILEAPRPARVGDSFNSGTLIGRFLGMLTLVPFD